MEIVLLEQARRDRDYWKRTGNERIMRRISSISSGFQLKKFFSSDFLRQSQKVLPAEGEPIPFHRQDSFVYRHKKCTPATRVAGDTFDPAAPATRVASE